MPTARLPLLALLLLAAGCGSPRPVALAPRGYEPRGPAPEKQDTRLTLNIRFRMGGTVSPETRVEIVSGARTISTRLRDCGVAQDDLEFIRYTTGGLVRRDSTCHVLITPPGEPSQVFDVPVPRRPPDRMEWTRWIRPASLLASPTPASTLRSRPDARRPVDLPIARQFEIRWQLTPLTSPHQPRAG